MSFRFRDESHPYSCGGLWYARALAANDFMYWDVMRRACTQGFRVFDFGRNKVGTGAYSFKKNWGFEAVPLPYTYKLITRETPPELNPTNPRFQTAIKIWKRLPITVANTVGPLIARDLG